MGYLKSDRKLEKSDCGIYEGQIDFLDEEGNHWYSKITVYGDTKKEVKEIRKKIIKTLNKSNLEETTK